MSEEPDFNDVLDEIVRGEERQEQTNYEEGLKAGRSEGNPEGYHLGYHRGAELGAELGYYLGVVTYHLSLHNKSETTLYNDKIIAQLNKVQKAITEFPRNNSEHHDLLGTAETIRAQYRKGCALLKIDASGMESRLRSLHRQIESVTSYLGPLLPLANCHTVEVLTRGLWELLPSPVRREVDANSLNQSVEAVWTAMENDNRNNTAMPELTEFVRTARAHHLTVDGMLILDREQAKIRLVEWGGTVREDPLLDQFVSPKKAHEVREMTWLIRSLGGSHCVELGGGKGYLGEALVRGCGMPALTVDCDATALAGGEKRTTKMQRVLKSNNLGKSGRHRYARVLVDENTDLLNIVKASFPEDSVDENSHMRLLITDTPHIRLSDLVDQIVRNWFKTEFLAVEVKARRLPSEVALQSLQESRLAKIGAKPFDKPVFKDYCWLHTCGDLGPSSLRILVRQPAAHALCNVPCCYHLLSERIDEHPLWGELKGGEVSVRGCEGFPMSQYLRGYVLGRNARMLASQSIDRTVHHRTLPSIGLHYRAILQVILKQHLPQSTIAEGRLKGIAAKCENFEHYFKMATEKLGLSIRPPESLTDVEENNRCHWKSMVMFYLLRLCLAQVVESLILLDRLLYLVESGFEKSFIVKLFDATKSPRCHAIVALR